MTCFFPGTWMQVITYEKSLRTAEYAFEFALLNNRKKVTAVHKANIMKGSDGLFLKACREVAPKFSSIKYEEMIVDNTCMQLVGQPQQFDVMVGAISQHVQWCLLQFFLPWHKTQPGTLFHYDHRSAIKIWLFISYTFFPAWWAFYP